MPTMPSTPFTSITLIASHLAVPPPIPPLTSAALGRFRARRRGVLAAAQPPCIVTPAEPAPGGFAAEERQSAVHGVANCRQIRRAKSRQLGRGTRSIRTPRSPHVLVLLPARAHAARLQLPQVQDERGGGIRAHDCAVYAARGRAWRACGERAHARRFARRDSTAPWIGQPAYARSPRGCRPTRGTQQHPRCGQANARIRVELPPEHRNAAASAPGYAVESDPAAAHGIRAW